MSNKTLINEQYDSMIKRVEFLEEQIKDKIRIWKNYGETAAGLSERERLMWWNVQDTLERILKGEDLRSAVVIQKLDEYFNSFITKE